MLPYLPDAANMRITFKDLNIQPSFPKMNGSSHTTDTCANDADGLDIEMLISHCSELRLASSDIQNQFDCESSEKRQWEVSRRAKETNASKYTAM
jgi:hypothetical protein